MIHARDDYNRIQDPAGRIPADEPVFLIRAQDRTGPAAVEAWAQLQYTLGGARDLALVAMNHADHMRIWQAQNGERVKTADAPATAGTMDGQPNPADALAERFYRLYVAAADVVSDMIVEPWEDLEEAHRRAFREAAAGILRGES
jgi:hypothetical protein